MSNNYYEILGLSNDASKDDIKKAYRSLSMKWHPDRNNSSEAAEMFKKINEANETLSDDGKKRQYDMQLNGFPGIQTFSFGFPGGGFHGNVEEFEINNVGNFQ